MIKSSASKCIQLSLLLRCHSLAPVHSTSVLLPMDTLIIIGSWHGLDWSFLLASFNQILVYFVRFVLLWKAKWTKQICEVNDNNQWESNGLVVGLLVKHSFLSTISCVHDPCGDIASLILIIYQIWMCLDQLSQCWWCWQITYHYSSLLSNHSFIFCTLDGTLTISAVAAVLLGHLFIYLFRFSWYYQWRARTGMNNQSMTWYFKSFSCVAIYWRQSSLCL